VDNVGSRKRFVGIRQVTVAKKPGCNLAQAPPGKAVTQGGDPFCL